MKRELHPAEHFVCGAVGGTCAVLVGHPFDTIKVRIQTSKQYKNTLDCMTKIAKKEGLYGFYKGITAPLLGYSPCIAVLYFGYGLGRQLFQCEREDHQKLRILAAGAFAGVVNTVVISPVERVKCLLQIQTDAIQKKYTGSADAVLQLYKEGGVSSVFRGSAATLVREVPANAFYFLTYAYLSEALVTPGQPASLVVTLFSGGMAGVANWTVAMPGDTLKSIIQTAPDGAYPGGLKQVCAELVKKEGITALFKGFIPAILRAFPACAACFLGFEVTATACRQIFQ